MRIIGGDYKGRRIKTCEGPGYRPATGKVRESLFSMLQARGVYFPEARVADMFAGSGSLGMECLSRGAEMVWFFEKARKAANLIRENLSEFRVEKNRYKVLQRDLFTSLSNPPEEKFNLGFIDPPYGKDLLVPALEKALEKGWFEEDALIVAEVEIHVEAPQEGPLSELELIADREYGQTRILLWRI